MEYGDVNYWDARYRMQEGTTFDWLESYSSLRETILGSLGLLDKVSELSVKEQKLQTREKASKLQLLNIGCGNSTLPEEMYDEDNFTNIVNTDISSVCIAQMAHRN